MESDKLPPIDFKEDEPYQPRSETTEVNFKKCDHKKAKIVHGELRCSCGAGWRGPGIAKLLQIM